MGWAPPLGKEEPRWDGTRTDYVRLAHRVWDPDRKRSQVQVLHSFGRADTLDVKGLRRLAESIVQFLARGGSARWPKRSQTGCCGCSGRGL